MRISRLGDLGLYHPFRSMLLCNPISMETEKTFIGTSPPNIKWGGKEIVWVISMLVASIIWSYMASTPIPAVIYIAFFALSLLLRLPLFARKTYIKVSDGILSISSQDAVLWTSVLKDITTIELEESSGARQVVANTALLIRNNRGDSYLLALDGITFEGLKPAELVGQLNEIKNRA
jgi:hypothetical protein